MASPIHVKTYAPCLVGCLQGWGGRKARSNAATNPTIKDSPVRPLMGWPRIYHRSQASEGQPSPPRPPPRQKPQQRIRPCNHRADDDGDDQAPTVHGAHLLSMAHRLRSSHRFSHQSSPQTPPTTTRTTITMTSPSGDTAWGLIAVSSPRSHGDPHRDVDHGSSEADGEADHWVTPVGSRSDARKVSLASTSFWRAGQL